MARLCGSYLETSVRLAALPKAFRLGMDAICRRDRLAWPTRFAEDFGRAASSSVEEMRGGTLGEAANAMRRHFGRLESAFKESADPGCRAGLEFCFLESNATSN